MKKTLIFLCVVSSLISTSGFANTCIEQMNQRTYRDYINLEKCELRSTDLPEVVSYINSHPSISHIDLTDNYIDSAGARYLTKIANKHLALVLDDNFIGDIGIEQIAYMQNISILYVQNNNISDEGLNRLKYYNNIEFLDIAYNASITPAGMSAAFCKNCFASLRGLIVDGIPTLGDETAQLLADHPIEFLGMAETQITDIGAKSLANNSNLISVDLSDTKISSIGIKALTLNPHMTAMRLSHDFIDINATAALSKDSNLQNLFLSGDNLTDSMMEVLAKNDSLYVLDVSFNWISYSGAASLSRMNKLSVLNIDHNRIGDRGAIAIAGMAGLMDIDLSNNEIGSAGAMAFSRHNDRFNYINLSNNKIGDLGASALAKAGSNVSWWAQYLNLSHNGIGDVGALELAKSTTMRGLDISYNNISAVGLKALRDNTFISLSNSEGNDDSLRSAKRAHHKFDSKFVFNHPAK
jgi:Leucine-rich repeat (LRR) protein